MDMQWFFGKRASLDIALHRPSGPLALRSTLAADVVEEGDARTRL